MELTGHEIMTAVDGTKYYCVLAGGNRYCRVLDEKTPIDVMEAKTGIGRQVYLID